MALSENDLRVLEQLERDLTSPPSPQRRHRRDRSLLLAPAGTTLGLTLLALGLWATSTIGTVVGVLGSILFLWASHTAMTAVLKSVLANPARWRLPPASTRR